MIRKKKSKAGDKADKNRLEQIQRTREEYKMSTNTGMVAGNTRKEETQR